MGQQDVLPIQVGGHLARLLKERGATATYLAAATGLSEEHVSGLLDGRCIMTADVAFLLGDFFGVSPLFWLELQSRSCTETRDGKEMGAARLVRAG